MRNPLRSGRHVAHNRSGLHQAAAHPPAKWWRRWLWYVNPQRFNDFWFTHPGRMAALRILGAGAGAAFVVIAGLFLFFAKDLPSPGKVNSLTSKQTTRFYDRTGQHLLYQVYGDENRSVVELDKIAKSMQQATIAVEDKDFYHHGAFSALGILRAAFNDLFNRSGGVQGGSTITQQYVKNALLSPERSLGRKIKELILSIQIEQLYNKDDILKLYLNEIPYGTQAYGVQAAAKTYFDKDAKNLSLDQAALLAAIPRAPTYYSPYGQHTDDLISRRNLILDLMHEQGYINDQQLAAAKKAKTLAKLNKDPNLYAEIKAPHFVLHAQEVLEEQLGTQQVTEGGLNVVTTLDWDLQKKAQAAVRAGIGTVDAAGGNNAALVAGDPKTGQILALVGSRSFRYPKYGTFNAATANRQPGSSFKPYVYATGFKLDNWGPGSVMYDVSTDFGNYRPNNYDRSFHGQLTIRRALANSYNIPAVKMLYIAGLKDALATAHDMGITTLNTPDLYGLSLVLGAGEVKLVDHVNGFETFANGGIHYEQTPILKATDPKGKVLVDNSNPQGKRVLDPQIPFLIQSILSDNNARSSTFGVNNPTFTYPGHTVAIKTGTTDSSRDGWMMGFTRSLTAGVWVGHNSNHPMAGDAGTLAGPTWSTFMRSALKGQPNEPFEKPNGIKRVTLDAYTGRLPGPGTRVRVADYFPSWYKPKPAANAKTVIINKFNGKLASDCTPAEARQKLTGYGIQPEIPPSDPAYPRWNPPVQALAKRLGIRGGTIPTEKDDCQDVRKPTVRLSTSSSGGGNVDIIAHINEERDSTYTLNNVVFKVNGSQVKKVALSGRGAKTVTIKYHLDSGDTVTAVVTDNAFYTGSDSLDYAFNTNSSQGRDKFFGFFGWPNIVVNRLLVLF